MLQKTDPLSAGLLSPMQQLILMHLRRSSVPISYYGIGRPIPGVARKRKGLRWEQTGAVMKMHHRTIRDKDGKIVRVEQPGVLKTGFYRSTQSDKQTRMRRRLDKGIPANA